MQQPDDEAPGCSEVRLQGLREAQGLVSVLQVLNSGGDLHELMRQVTALLRDWSGCEAVGIRLREGDDFPYFETRGFPVDFILAENRLCTVDGQGRPVKDSFGNPCLECMCGNVICGRTDPSKPFFTGRGSFWTNSTTQLLASTSEADRQARTRNRCNGEGYESVALIPLVAGPTPLGLLQLNDGRTDRFTPELITFLEVLAGSIAVYLAHRQATAEVAELASDWKTTFDAVGDAVWLLDEESRILRCNQAMHRILNLDERSIVGRHCWEVVHQTPAPCPECPSLRMRESLQRERIELDVRGRWCQIVVDPVFDAEGRLKGAVHVLSDITERKEAADRQARLEGDLRNIQKLDAMGQVAAGLAHDCGNLVTVAEGQLYIARSAQFSELQRREALEAIAQVAAQAKLIIRSLLTFSRRGPLEMRRVDLCELLRGLEPMWRHGVGSRCELELDLPAEVVWIHADPGQLTQVFINLLINARDAMPQGGSVRIACTLVRSPGSSTVRLVVTDTGSGIPPDTLPRVFEPFFTTKERGMGTGLGLAIVHGIVLQHNGQIEIQSEPGAGTSVIMTLPASGPASISSVPSGGEPSA